MFKYTYIYNIPAKEIQYDIFRRILRSQSINDEMRRTRITSKNTRITERPIKTDQKLADWKKSTSGMFPPGQAGILGDDDGSFQL